MATFKEQRVGIFIDVQNLYHSAKNLYNSRVNFAELIRQLSSGRKLIRAIAYVVRAEGVEESSLPALPGREAAFFEALRKSGLELRMKDIQIYHGGVKKADWDVGLAVDSIRMASGLDTIILVTGDGDFLPLIDYLRWGLGREVEVAAFSSSASGKLKESADKVIAIEGLPRMLRKIKSKIDEVQN